MSFSIGIVGLPNVGKSTLFKALTKIQVDASNYPFCTIEPNIGCVAVPDERLVALSKVSDSEKTIFTTIEFVDIAGLVKGASKGEGLGNKFLHNIREVDAICHVVRTFHDPNVIHVSGKVSPQDDMEIIALELIYADIDTVQKRLSAVQKTLRDPKNINAKKHCQFLERLKAHLDSGMPSRSLLHTEEESPFVKELNLLSEKPVLTVYNITEKEINAHSNNDKEIHISAKIESELVELNDDEQREMLMSLGIRETGLFTLIKASYRLLGLLTFFTSGKEESRAWTVPAGTKAPQAAGVIHSDFEKNFIRAEVIDWKHFVDYGETLCKEKGLLRVEGKDYVIRDGDVCHFRVNV